MHEAERQELLVISGRDDEGKNYIGSSQESDSDTKFPRNDSFKKQVIIVYLGFSRAHL